MQRILMAAGLLLASLAVAKESPGQDELELTHLLDQFLAGADEPAMHQRFWDETLVYTASSGRRMGKAEILQGLHEVAAGNDTAGGPVYSAEEVDVRLYGDVAVIAFRLLAREGDGEQRYYNTGTFLRRGGAWRAVAWQATRIP